MSSSFKSFGMLAVLALLASGAQGADVEINHGGALGVGAGLGQPLGVTGKFWFSSLSAVDAMMGYHVDDNFDVHADYLLHAYPFTGVPNGKLPLYVGLGGRILAGDDTQFGLRIPLGLSYLCERTPIELFAEVAPVIRLNGISASVDGMVGIRLYTAYLSSVH